MFSQDTLPKYLVSNHIHYGYSRNFAESTDFSQLIDIPFLEYFSQLLFWQSLGRIELCATVDWKKSGPFHCNLLQQTGYC